MKSTVIIILIALTGLVTINSCKKKYRCVCNDGLVVNQYEDKMSKAGAEEEKTKCMAADSTCVFERDKRK